MKLFYFLLPLFIPLSLAAQTEVAKDSVVADFQTTVSDSGTKFKALLPPLRGTVGGRAPFYSYLWDFGDGHFSYQKSPVHRYADTGKYIASLYVVNNYDDGPRPKRRAKGVNVAAAGSEFPSVDPAEKSFFSSNGIFQIAKNTNALPGQNMTLIVGVKHPGKGRVFLLTNEKTYGVEGLVYLNQTSYNKEQILPPPVSDKLQGLWASVSHATVTYSGSPDYGIKQEFIFKPDESIKYFSDLYGSYKTISNYEVESADGTPQFSFINLKATPEMLADTNAIITVTGVYLPEDGGKAVIHKVEVPVVTSHDPNNMSIKNARMSYRTLSKSKNLIYKIKFQNDGEGDAKNIRLEMVLPEQVNPSTFNLLSLYPYCDSCKTANEKGCWQLYNKGEDTLVFHFKDISLPGRQAEDITDPDSTKGFIRFSVHTDKKLRNKPFRASTLIFFDKNEPIETNLATGRFRKGFSPIIFAGYNSFMPQFGHNNIKYKEKLMLGIGVAPIAPYKKFYFQFEAYGNLNEYTQTIKNAGEKGSIAIEVTRGDDTVLTEYAYKTYHRNLESKNLNIRIVPLHLRYNLTNFISAGIGALAQFKIDMDSKEDRTYIPAEAAMEPVRREIGTWEDSPGKDFKIIPFLDLNVGRVYLGPSLGLRYYNGGSDSQHLNLYLAWRF